ncbi:lipoprotein N-acyltransferase Lnb domain-containing protein [Tenacibaculum dicentrarchi]|uniref:lipoprotein N-acyltransferase Lnb domain-containing protein n=1 Tax=Tenacibaculum dicentrarchi TaxID=669041 RepID=UPI003512E18D
MIKKITTIFLFLCCFNTVLSQVTDRLKLSNNAQISIITSGPGEALYEKFGHSAIRVKDPVLNFDFIYNYGIFDFENPTFYADFTKGYMKYKLAKYPFYLALKNNQQHKRWVKEQVLNLSQVQKNEFFTILEINILPENAGYLYDPYFDNCATKPRDIIKKVVGKNLIFKDDFVRQKMSLRQLMNNEIHQNTWGSLGINIALGSRLDKVATANEYLYLPDYVFEALNYSKILKDGEEDTLISKTNILLYFDEKQPKSDNFSPFLIILVLSLLGLCITYKDYKNAKRSKWLDFIIFFISGITGVLIVYLWFFTNHSTAPNNFNFLWAFAPNLIVSFFLIQKKSPKWISKYMLLLLAFLVILAIIWVTKTQLFSITLIPLFVLFAVRYWFLQKTLNR